MLTFSKDGSYLGDSSTGAKYLLAYVISCSDFWIKVHADLN